MSIKLALENVGQVGVDRRSIKLMLVEGWYESYWPNINRVRM